MPSVLPPLTCTDDRTPGSYKCQKNCVICREHMVERTTFDSHTTGEVFQCRQAISCDDCNLIYLLYCSKCKQSQYVGETQNTLKTRFYLHRSHILKNTGTHVTKHFNSKNHTLQDMRCMPIEKLRTNNREHRQRRERFWQHKLKTFFPEGLNTV